MSGMKIPLGEINGRLQKNRSVNLKTRQQKQNTRNKEEHFIIIMGQFIKET